MSQTDIYSKEFLAFLNRFLTPERIEHQDRVLEDRTKHITAVIEDVYQPHNASAVIRTCDCFGLQDVHIIEEDHNFKMSSNVALGSSQWVNIHKYRLQENNTLDCLKHIKKQGYKIVATTPHTEKSIYDVDLDQPVALVFGNEKRGISDLVREHADELVKIPMYGFTESFNISVSAALCLSVLVEKLRTTDIKWGLTEEEKNKLRVDWAKSHLGSIDKYIFEFERILAEKA